MMLDTRSLHDTCQKPITRIKETTENNRQNDLRSGDHYERLKRAQVDLIEVQVEQANDIKCFFVYEDLVTKFVILQALNNGNVHEIALKLLDILAILGIPIVLQSNNGRVFAEQIVREVRSLWKGLHIFHGEISKFYNSKRDFKDLLQSWLKENPSKTWYEGLKSIQIHQNSTYSIGGKSPCQVLFGSNVFKMDRTPELTDIWSEEEWYERMSTQNDYYTLKTNYLKITGKEQEIESDEDSELRANTSRLRHCRQDHFSFVNVKNDVLLENKLQENFTCNKDIQGREAEHEQSEMSSKLQVDENNENLKCKFCNKQYIKLGHLKNHLKSHRKNHKFECSFCHETYDTQHLYNTHMEQIHKHVENGCNKNGRVGQYSEYDAPVKGIFIASEQMDGISNNKSFVQMDAISSNKSSEQMDGSSSNKSSDEEHTTHGHVNDIKHYKTCQSSTRKNVSTVKTNGELECTYCKQKFNFPSVLKRHMRSHTNERPYVCDICQKSFKQLGHLSQHSLTHRDYRSFRCMVCGVKFEALDDLKIHFQTHKGDKIAIKSKDIYRLFECDNCKKVFTTKSVLERHIFTHTHERQFGCKICGKRFKQAGHVKSHMLIHTGERKFECTVCKKKFSLSNSLKKHMYVHNGEKPYQCDMCGARFLERRNLNGHLMTHTNERPFSCKICGKRYTLADTLRRHVSAAHEDGRTYQCEICAKMFKQLAHLSVHKKVHNDERPFQCHLCDKNFKHKNVLKSHLAIHANVRPFECDVCKATFVRKTNLQTHIASAHMNERPYTCTICGKRFKQISHLNGHVVVHSNLMPYQCNFCDRRCNRLDNLKKHMRLHTKNKERIC